MDRISNPYTPNAGATPPVLIGRSGQLENFKVSLARLQAGRTEQSMIVTGLRGVGKTTLLNTFRTLAEEMKWCVVYHEASKFNQEQFRLLIATSMRKVLGELASKKVKASELLSRAFGVFSSFALTVDADGKLSAGLNANPVIGRGDTGRLDEDLTELFLAVGAAAKEQTTGVLILIDEIQFLQKEQLEAVIMALHRTVQHALPLTLVGAGLPQIAELTGEAKSYSERLFTFPVIGPFSEEDTKTALREPAKAENVVFEEAALETSVDITQGYPYFVQELGSIVWQIAQNNQVTKADIIEAETPFIEKLDMSFFRVRLDRTTELEQAYLRAMASLGPEPQPAAKVANLLNRTSAQCGPVRSGLIQKGLLYTPAHGLAAFTVPLFHEFMIRKIPVFSPPPIRPRIQSTEYPQVHQIDR